MKTAFASTASVLLFHGGRKTNWRSCAMTERRFDPMYQFMTSQQLAYDLFESED